MIYLILALNLIAAKVAFAQTPDVVFKNNKGVGMLKEEDKSFEAKDFLQKEVVNNPNSPELKYNFGQSLEVAKENEAAIREYLTSAKRAQGDLQFQGFFNAARLYGEAKDIPNALKYYQMALDLKPDSQEVKTNIELLLAKGGGGGGGSSDKKEENKDQKKDQKDQKQPQDQKQQPDKPQNEQKKKQPKPFKSEELSEQDVKRILEELKRQEEQIRAKMLNNRRSKEQPVEKDW